MTAGESDRPGDATPRAVIGIPVYNHAHKLRQALDSILQQTNTDFRIIVCDDRSSDATPEIVAEYVRKDPRVSYHPNEKRLGYIGNARRCFDLAYQLYPDAPFFAWGSDHDVWHERWLEALMSALEAHPDAVLACPFVQRIDADDAILPVRTREVTTVGQPRSLQRFRKTFNEISAGNMVYGLMRSDALKKIDGLPWHVLPDRLLLVELSLYGTMITVPEYLWFRRYRGLASRDRQISASFLDGRPPAYIKLPWGLAHSGHLFHKLVVSPSDTAPVGPFTGAGYSLLYLILSIRHVIFRSFRSGQKKLLQYASRHFRRRRETLMNLREITTRLFRSIKRVQPKSIRTDDKEKRKQAKIEKELRKQTRVERSAQRQSKLEKQAQKQAKLEKQAQKQTKLEAQKQAGFAKGAGFEKEAGKDTTAED